MEIRCRLRLVSTGHWVLCSLIGNEENGCHYQIENRVSQKLRPVLRTVSALLVATHPLPDIRCIRNLSFVIEGLPWAVASASSTSSAAIDVALRFRCRALHGRIVVRIACASVKVVEGADGLVDDIDLRRMLNHSRICCNIVTGVKSPQKAIFQHTKTLMPQQRP